MRRSSNRVNPIGTRLHGILLLLALGCHDATKPAQPAVAHLRVYGGNNQVAYDTVSRLGLPLAARVTDDANQTIAGVRVQWTTVSGAGEFTNYPDGGSLTNNVTVSSSEGLAIVYFRPRVFGAITVAASATDSVGTPVEFHAVISPQLRPPDVLITAGPLFDCTGGFDPTRYWLGGNTRDTVLSATVGQRVGFHYADYLAPVCTARFKSIDVPPGGTPFDGGITYAGTTFEFTPNAVGVWTFTDAINGGNGKLTVRAP